MTGDREIPPLLGELRFGMILLQPSPFGVTSGYQGPTQVQIEIFTGVDWVLRDSAEGIEAHNRFVRASQQGSK